MDRFERMAERKNIGNLKQTLENELDLVLSGAEMDYPTAPIICEAIEKFAKKGIFGYTLADDNYRQSIIEWMKQVRNLNITKEDIVPTHGTIFGLDTAIRAFTKEGDGIIVQHPAFHHYDKDIRKNNRVVISNQLIDNDGIYSINFIDLEQKMSDSKNKMLILCNPHNPTGKVFNEDELKEIARLANRYQVIVYSDEIFGEITFENHQAIPYLSIDPYQGIMATSLGKSFNLTGVNHANIFIKNKEMRDKYIKQRDKEHFGSIDPFFYVSLTAAYSKEGYDWLEEMKEHTWKNYIAIKDFLQKQLPELIVSPLEGGFIIWINFKNWQLDDEQLQNYLEKELHIIADPGNVYKQSQCYRFNIATPHNQIIEFLNRLKRRNNL